MDLDRTRDRGRHVRRYLITGIITVIPLWITWWVFTFILNQLSRFGMPWVRAAGRAVEPVLPGLAQWVLHPWFQFTCAVILTLLLLILLGWLTTRVLGKRLLMLVDRVMQAIPLAEQVYGAARKLVTALQNQPEHVERVVLIPFPSQDMKAVGFVTRVFEDPDTGAQLAAVYVPTTPNPTSGYLEIVPIEHVVSTTWTVEEAMSFIISGGTVAPDTITYAQHTVATPVAHPAVSRPDMGRAPSDG